MNAEERFALERDAFERRSLGLPARVFYTNLERVEFARSVLRKEEERRNASKLGTARQEVA